MTNHPTTTGGVAANKRSEGGTPGIKTPSSVRRDMPSSPSSHGGAQSKFTPPSQPSVPATTSNNDSSALNNHVSPSSKPRLEECDYDRAPTVLYKTIERRSWDDVLKLLMDVDSDSDDDDRKSNQNSHLQDKKSKKKSRRSTKQEASVWVVRKERDGRLRWRLLPLHAALIFNAPLSVIEALLKVFPAAATLKDDQGMLPLHLACRNTPLNFEVLEELLTTNPAAVYVKDRKGRTPIQGGLAATGMDKNPGLSVMELYTQIAAAGERQRWRTESEQQTSQKLQLLVNQHQEQIEKLKGEHEAQWKAEKEKWSVATGSISAQLSALVVQHEETKQALETACLQHEQTRQELEKERAASSASVVHNNKGVCSMEEYEKVVQTNKQLQAIIALLLDQHSNLQDSLHTLQMDQEKWHEQRNAIMRQYCNINEQAAATSQAHASIWQEELSGLGNHVKQVLDRLASSGMLADTKDEESLSASSGKSGRPKDETKNNHGANWKRVKHHVSSSTDLADNNSRKFHTDTSSEAALGTKLSIDRTGLVDLPTVPHHSKVSTSAETVFAVPSDDIDALRNCDSTTKPGTDGSTSYCWHEDPSKSFVTGSGSWLEDPLHDSGSWDNAGVKAHDSFDTLRKNKRTSDDEIEGLRNTDTFNNESAVVNRDRDEANSEAVKKKISLYNDDEKKEEESDYNIPTPSASNLRNPAAVVLTNHGAEVLP